jgi:murein DD-endopeptidase MepM/ murein hydrolase activator NlpD
VIRPRAFGRGLGLVTLGLVVLPLLVRECSLEVAAPPARARFALPATGPPAAPLVTLRSPGGSVPAAPPTPDVVLRVRPLPAAEPRSASAPPAPPPYPLLIPVAGVRPEDLTDTFGDARDSARVHRAIDLLAPTGTPVVAAVDGHIIRKHTSDLGGLTLYQVGPDSAWVFYYAHLDRYAEGLRAGSAVAQGDTLGFVGETGNAPIPHLHFAVWKARPGSKRLWGGRAVNPFPLLRSSPLNQTGLTR